MTYCYEHAIPHSEFLGWSDADRAKVLAYQAEQSLRCVGCGTAPWEWDAKQGGSKFAYEPENRMCQGCYIKHMAAQDQTVPPGTTVHLVKLDRTEKARRVVHARKRQARDKADNLRGEPTA